MHLPPGKITDLGRSKDNVAFNLKSLFCEAEN